MSKKTIYLSTDRCGGETELHTVLNDFNEIFIEIKDEALYQYVCLDKETAQYLVDELRDHIKSMKDE
jgi:hypothetical protein